MKITKELLVEAENYVEGNKDTSAFDVGVDAYIEGYKRGIESRDKLLQQSKTLIMGIKKIARPINKAKNLFVKWLKDKEATDIDIFEGDDLDCIWDYYRSVDAFIGCDLYVVVFEMWQGEVKISYSDGENGYDNMSIEEFLKLIS